MNIPKSVYNYIMLFCVLLFAGILFGNPILVLVSLVPFLLLLMGTILKLPYDIDVKRELSSSRIYTDDILEVSIEIQIKAGIGAIAITDILPQELQLYGGNNLIVLWKGFGEKKAKMSYRVHCSNAGVYSLDNMICEVRHCIYDHGIRGEVKKSHTVKVIPRVFAPNRIKGMSGASKIPQPMNAISRTGISTLEFKEIRSYNYGDSFKNINWKASSRNVFRGGFWPVINEYDKEGKKIVWFFLDCSRSMDTGTNMKSTFDYGIEAVCQLSNYYIKQQCSTAFCAYNSENSFIYPGTGDKQYYKILSTALKLNMNRENSTIKQGKNLNLLESIMFHRSHISGYRPLFVIVTKHSRSNHNELRNGIKDMAKYSANQTGRQQIMVINIKSNDLETETVSDRTAAELLDLRDSKLVNGLKKSCIWIDWNPKKNSLFHSLLKQIDYLERKSFMD